MARSCKIFVASRASECTNWIHFIPLGFPVAFEYVWIWRGLLHYVAPCGTPTPIHFGAWRVQVEIPFFGREMSCTMWTRLLFYAIPPPPLNPGFGFERVDSWRNSRKTHAISFRRWWETVLKSCKLVMKIHVSTSDFGGFCRASQIPYPRLEFMDALQEITATAAPGRMLMNKNQT